MRHEVEIIEPFTNETLMDEIAVVRCGGEWDCHGQGGCFDIRGKSTLLPWEQCPRESLCVCRHGEIIVPFDGTNETLLDEITVVRCGGDWDCHGQEEHLHLLLLLLLRLLRPQRRGLHALRPISLLTLRSSEGLTQVRS